MRQILKLLHFIGLTIFLGSIITFVVISNLIEGASLENILFGRNVISARTFLLTLPAMWLIAVTGIWMGYKKYGIKNRFFQLKFFLILLIVLNAHFLVTPAVTLATELATQSYEQGNLLSSYYDAYMKESIFGAINVLLTITAAVIGVWRIGVNSTHNLLHKS
ncbi:MAG: hypothetical protein PHW27_04310 [Melioribacteraceae bacterium]|nr:hypothetical protein [Melioribacteraceae bacterium]